MAALDPSIRVSVDINEIMQKLLVYKASAMTGKLGPAKLFHQSDGITLVKAAGPDTLSIEANTHGGIVEPMETRPVKDLLQVLNKPGKAAVEIQIFTPEQEWATAYAEVPKACIKTALKGQSPQALVRFEVSGEFVFVKNFS